MSTLITRTQDGVLLAYFHEVRIVDEALIENIGSDLLALVSEATHDKMILNFKNVAFMSSAMIGKLILFGKKCGAANIALRLCGINDNIQQVFDLMNLEKLFNIDSDEEQSLEHLKSDLGWPAD
ncbi:MAG: STAS domain-containing protein [Pirellulaceae bacterium]|jgi:anti-sigma B factor antagonist|nr:STAS domain-containing protein [Pirellulaceae bacterium]